MFFKNLMVENLADRIEYVQVLHDASEIKYNVGERHGAVGDIAAANERAVYFALPVVKPDVVVPVIEIILK